MRTSGSGPGRLPDEARAFGLALRSWYRSPAQNKMTAHSAPTSYHLAGTAYDFTGAPGDMNAFAEYVRNNYGPNLAELYHGGIGWKNGQPAKPIPYHNNHVHVAWQGSGIRGQGSVGGEPGDSDPINRMDKGLDERAEDEDLDAGHRQVHSESFA